MSFGANPLTNDLIAIKNASAISRSIRNIVMTLPGEKPFEPQYGSKVSKVLFQNMDMISSGIIVDEIRTSINNFEPRVELLSVESNPDFDSNSYDVTIKYEIISFFNNESFSRYSDKTAPYSKCLEFITPTEVMAINVEAPPDNNCKKTICEAPPKIIIDIA